MDGARAAGSPRVEIAGAALVLLGIGLAVARLLSDGYLPQPFYFRVGDSLMDLYSTAYWANNGQAYDGWQSIYPPLSFVFLRLFTVRRCYAVSDFAGRDCDGGAFLALLAFFLVNIGLVYATYRISDRRTAIPRTIAMAIGLPMLYALERGNLLIPCFTGFVLGYGGLIRRQWGRWLAMALSINFKPYLIFAAVPFTLRRDWRWVFGCGLIGLLIYLVTLAIYGSGSPGQIITDERIYSMEPSKGHFLDLYYATAYWPLIRVLHAYPVGLRLLPAGASDAVGLILTVGLRGAQLGTLACACLALARPAAVDVRRFGALLVGVALTGFTTGSAGYAQIFLFFLVFFEPWRGPVRIVVLSASYLLCLPIDFPILPVIHAPALSFLGGRVVMATSGLSVGHLLRPGVLLVIQYGLIVLNLADSLGAPGAPWSFTRRGAGRASTPA